MSHETASAAHTHRILSSRRNASVVASRSHKGERFSPGWPWRSWKAPRSSCGAIFHQGSRVRGVGGEKKRKRRRKNEKRSEKVSFPPPINVFLAVGWHTFNILYGNKVWPWDFLTKSSGKKCNNCHLNVNKYWQQCIETSGTSVTTCTSINVSYRRRVSWMKQLVTSLGLFVI